MENVNYVALVVAVLGAGGLGAFLREVADMVTKYRSGVSAKESDRKRDLATQLAAANDAADRERQRRIGYQEYAGMLRSQLRENGHEPAAIPEELEDTLNPKRDRGKR